MEPNRCRICGTYFFGAKCQDCGEVYGRIDFESEPNELDQITEIIDDILDMRDFYGEHS